MQYQEPGASQSRLAGSATHFFDSLETLRTLKMRTLLYLDVKTSRNRCGSTVTPGLWLWPCSLYSSDSAIMGVGVILWWSTNPNAEQVGSPGQMSLYTEVPIRAMCGDLAVVATAACPTKT